MESSVFNVFEHFWSIENFSCNCILLIIKLCFNKSSMETNEKCVDLIWKLTRAVWIIELIWHHSHATFTARNFAGKRTFSGKAEGAKMFDDSWSWSHHVKPCVLFSEINCKYIEIDEPICHNLTYFPVPTHRYLQIFLDLNNLSLKDVMNGFPSLQPLGFLPSPLRNSPKALQADLAPASDDCSSKSQPFEVSVFNLAASTASILVDSTLDTASALAWSVDSTTADSPWVLCSSGWQVSPEAFGNIVTSQTFPVQSPNSNCNCNFLQFFSVWQVTFVWISLKSQSLFSPVPVDHFCSVCQWLENDLEC